jgi:hypothetical protein
VLDELSLLKGIPYKINDQLSIKHPTLNEIFEYGEENYFRAVNLFCLKPYDLMVQLNDMGIEYDTIDNYELFLMLYNLDYYKKDIDWLLNKNSNISYMLKLKEQYVLETSKERKKVILDKVFQELNNYNQQYNFQKYVNQQNNEIVLYDNVVDVKIDRLIYYEISTFLKAINHILEKNEFNPANKTAKKMILSEKRRELEKLQKSNKKFDSVLSKLVSSIVWNENSKVGIKDVWNLHIYQVYDGLCKIQKRDNYKQTMQGIYAGTIDQSKIDLSKIDWISK